MRSDQERPHPRLERRDFLRGLGVAAGGAAAAAAAVPAGAAEPAETSQERTKKRYRESEHVKRFYALNRL